MVLVRRGREIAEHGSQADRTLTPDQRGKSPSPRSAHNPVGHERDHHHECDADDLPADDIGGVVTGAKGPEAGAWVIASGLMRYAFIAMGSIAPWIRAALPPSRRRQTVCVVQIAALIIVMLPAIEPPASVAIAAAALVTLTASFLIDTAWLWRQREA